MLREPGARGHHGRRGRAAAAATAAAAAARFDAVPTPLNMASAGSAPSATATAPTSSESVSVRLPARQPLPPVAATTEALIAELHARTYSWEALERAGLNFSSVQEEELLSWLKRDAAKFNEILTRSSLGLETQPTMQLLRTLSRRADLATALKESGLGSGSDFQCSFDESPRDGGCQIKCDGGRTSKCDRAERKCRELGHCVRVDLNRDHTWATLKSLQVYMPAPPPVCDGYAFGANGSAPVPIEAPLAVEFDDLGPGGAPREEDKARFYLPWWHSRYSAFVSDHGSCEEALRRSIELRDDAIARAAAIHSTYIVAHLARAVPR